MDWNRKSVSCDDFEVGVKRSRRRSTVAISVRDGVATIAVPTLLPYSEVNKLVKTRQGWISDKLREQQQRKLAVHRDYVTGERFAYLGQTYELQVVLGLRKTANAPVRLAQGQLTVTLVTTTDDAPKTVRDALISWYREHAEKYLISRNRHYSTLLGVIPSAINIREYKSRWGSCSANGLVSYNWRIIMAKPAVIDYLVVHELCHLHHLDHSKSFWRRVANQLPDYQESRRWLASNGWTLAI